MKAEQKDKVHRLPQGIDLNQIAKAVGTLVEHNSKKNQESLFPEANAKVLLDITTYKIPDGDNHFFPIVLPHSPYPESSQSDILLLIPDDLKDKTEPEQLVNNMKDKLVDAGFGIKIREVMTLRQCRDEYSTYEAKRALAKRIDLILADTRIYKNLPSILGREFYAKKKFALTVDLEKDNEQWDAEFQFALRKTMLNVSTKGTTTTLAVGHSGLTVEQIVDNISKVTNWMMRKYPGGWSNISKLSVNISSPGIPPLVIYIGQGSRNEVTKSVRKGRKLPEPEEDELSTLPGRRVRVYPKGEIEVLKDEVLSDEETVEELGVDKELEPITTEPETETEPPKKKTKKSTDSDSGTGTDTPKSTTPTKKQKGRKSKSKSKVAKV